MGMPFKFNHSWLEAVDFNTLIRDFWTQYRDTNDSPMQAILGNIYALKMVVKKWEHWKKKKMIKGLADIKVELGRLDQALDMGNSFVKIINNIKELEAKNKKILHVQEVTWKLKSRALWLKEGDRNTKFFHGYENHRRQVNTIWGIKDSNGFMVQSLPKIQQAKTKFFEDASKTRDARAIEDKIWGFDSYPTMFDSDKN